MKTRRIFSNLIFFINVKKTVLNIIQVWWLGTLWTHRCGSICTKFFFLSECSFSFLCHETHKTLIIWTLKSQKTLSSSCFTLFSSVCTENIWLTSGSMQVGHTDLWAGQRSDAACNRFLWMLIIILTSAMMLASLDTKRITVEWP